MNDARTAIVLAAGASRRMGELTRERPKSLLPYRGCSVLARLLGQLGRTSLERIVVVVGYQGAQVRELVQAHAARAAHPAVVVVDNGRYAEDTNIHSMNLALAHVTGSVVIFEADTLMEDAMVAYVCGADFEHQSAWFTRGPFLPGMHGGIVKSDAAGVITDVRVVPRWEPDLAEHSKMAGIMRICAAQVPAFRGLVAAHAARSLAQYFFAPWAEHLQELPSIEADARHYRLRTFNTPEDYADALTVDFDPPPAPAVGIDLVAPSLLKHIEGHDEARVDALLRKVEREGVWTKPLYIERDHHLVLDGQHRLEVALRLGLARVPVQRFGYPEVAVWTLRKQEQVDVATVIRRANAGQLYPYKTVKHKFPGVIDACQIPLTELT